MSILLGPERSDLRVRKLGVQLPAEVVAAHASAPVVVLGRLFLLVLDDALHEALHLELVDEGPKLWHRPAHVQQQGDRLDAEGSLILGVRWTNRPHACGTQARTRPELCCIDVQPRSPEHKVTMSAAPGDAP